MRIGEKDCRRLLDELLRERNLNAKDFFGTTKLKHYVEARVEAMKRMKEFTDATHRTIAFVLKRNISFIDYHISEKVRARRSVYYKSERYRKYHAERRKLAKSVKDNADLRNGVAGEHQGLVGLPLNEQRRHGAGVDHAY